MDTEEYLEKLFTDAGWHQGRRIELVGVRDVECGAHNCAVNILNEYGGLAVGETGAGRDCAASNIEFYSRPRYEADGLCEEWESKTGKLVAIANAHNQHIMVLVNQDGEFYIFTDPDEQLYHGGSFNETTSKLLLGINYGPAIAKA